MRRISEVEMNDSQQKLAIDYPIIRPLKIIACPGSGKTFVLIKRLIRILNEISNTFENKILVLTFSKNGSLEIQKRLSLECHPATHFTKISTYHSLSYHIIRENLVEAGLRACPSVITTRQSISIINVSLYFIVLTSIKIVVVTESFHGQRERRQTY